MQERNSEYLNPVLLQNTKRSIATLSEGIKLVVFLKYEFEQRHLSILLAFWHF